MDEKALQYAYDLFKADGYENSIDDFKNLLNSNPDAFNYSYKLFKADGYKDSEQDFANLLGVKKNENFNQDTDSPSGSGTSGFFDSSKKGFATEVPEGEGFKKFKSALKTTVSGLARLPVSLRELDVSIRQSLDPEFKKEYNKLSEEDREKILSTTPGVGITGKIPTPLIGVDDMGKDEWGQTTYGEEVSRYYGGSEAIEFSQRQQQQADIINESLAKFETSIGQDLFSIENTGRGTQRLINEVVGAIPSLVLAMTPGGIYALGASAASNKSRALQEEGQDLTVSRYINAVGTGVAEGYFEKFTRGLGNSSFKILKQLYKEGGASKVKESFTSIVYNFLKGFNIEGTSEVMTDVSERALDLVLAGDEKAFENWFLETADTYIIGGSAGGPVKVAGPGMRLIQQQAQIKNLGKKVSESQYSDLVNVFKPETGDFTVDISQLPIVEAPNSELFLNETLKREVKKGKITPLEMQEIMDNYNMANDINNELEGAELSDVDKNKAASLLQEQINLKELVGDKNPALYKKQRDRIAAIDKELEIISETQFGIETEQQATREEAEKALLDEGIESPTQEQVLSKLDEIIQQSAPVTTTIPLSDTQTEETVTIDSTDKKLEKAGYQVSQDEKSAFLQDVKENGLEESRFSYEIKEINEAPLLSIGGEGGPTADITITYTKPDGTTGSFDTTAVLEPFVTTESQVEVAFDEDIDVVPPNELPLQKVLRKDDVIREKIQDEKSDASQRKKATLELISKLQPKGEVFARRAKSLIKEVAKLNFKNPVKVNQFIEKIDKTFDDAALKKELKDARDEKKSIAKKVSQLKKKDKLFGNLATPAQQFLKINPNKVDNLKEYMEIAKKLNTGLIPTKKVKGRAKPGSPFIVSEIDAYSSRELNKIKEEQQQLEEETYKALMGDLETNIPLKELKSLLYPEAELTPEEKIKQANKKEKEIRSSLAKGFDSIGGVIQSILDTGVDPFSNEVINIDKQQKDLVERFLKIDTSKLTNQEAAFALDVLNNFATNGSTANMAKIVNNYEGNISRENDIKDGLKISESRIPIKDSVEALWLEGLASLTQTIDFVFNSRKKASQFSDNSSLSNVQSDFARAETESLKIREKYKKEFPNSKKPNNEAYNTEDNITERGLFAFVRRSLIGTKKDKQEEFNRRKKLIENDVIAFENSIKDEEKELGALYRRVFDKILKDSNNPDEVQAKVDPINVEGVEWITEQWRTIKPLLDRIGLEIYNRDLKTEENYTSDIFRTKVVEEVPDLDAPISDEISQDRKIYDKETGLFKDVTGPSILIDRYVDLNFDNNQLNNIRRALADAYSAENIAKLKGYLESNDIKEILGEGESRDIVINKIKKYVNSKRGRKKRTQGQKDLADVGDLGATIGTARVLGGITQYIKQTVPLVNTFVNAGGVLTSEGFEAYLTNKKFRDFVKNSGYAIANRGIGSTAVIDNIQDDVKKKANTPIQKIKKGVRSVFKLIKKANQFWLEKFLLPGDKVAANISWITYYAKEMKKKGINIFEEGFDIENHTINKEAANEAQRNVDRFQYVSDVDLQAELYNPDREFVRVAMKSFMPFSSFIMNEKTRNYIDVQVISDPNTSFEEKGKAMTSLTGTVLEKIVFGSLGVMIATASYATVLSLLGIDDEEEAKEKLNNRVKGRAGNMVTDFFSPLPIIDPFILQVANYLIEQVDKGEDGQDPFQFFEGNNRDFFEQFGVFSITFEQADAAATLQKIHNTGKIDDYELNDAEKEAVSILLKLAYLNGLGALPSDLSAQPVQYGLSRLQKIASEAREAGQTSSSMTKRQMESILGENIYEESDEMKKQVRDIIREAKDELNIFD